MLVTLLSISTGVLRRRRGDAIGETSRIYRECMRRCCRLARNRRHGIDTERVDRGIIQPGGLRHDAGNYTGDVLDGQDLMLEGQFEPTSLAVDRGGRHEVKSIVERVHNAPARLYELVIAHEYEMRRKGADNVYAHAW
jgi:hypothetical protein